MTEITLNSDQFQAIQTGTGPIIIRNQNGDYLGHLNASFSPEEIAEIEMRLESDEPRFTTKVMLEHLHTLAPEAP